METPLTEIVMEECRQHFSKKFLEKELKREKLVVLNDHGKGYVTEGLKAKLRDKTLGYLYVLMKIEKSMEKCTKVRTKRIKGWCKYVDPAGGCLAVEGTACQFLASYFTENEVIPKSSLREILLKKVIFKDGEKK